MRISDWSSDVCSSDLRIRSLVREHASPHFLFIDETAPMLEDPIFCTSVKTLLREHRKLRESVNLCFQDASDIESSGIAERSEESRVGKECVSTVRLRGQAYH